IGWAEGHTRGMGWIALAIVIFGGWSPLRGAIGALLFGATKALATQLQNSFPQISVVAFNAIPWILLIAVLLVVSNNVVDRLLQHAPPALKQPLLRLLRVMPPGALGEELEQN